MKPIIEVQGLSKKYQINANKPRYLSLRDSVTGFFKFNKQDKKEDFWALQDVNFTVEAGESVGIIGRNGAGKSTLLKILSRITPPTKGNIILRGRIVSLLEVGTGFHPELSGRENVYFNGSILGLKKAEIDKKFDEIIDFSGVEQFIDTPLKHYSSGMKLRLAFSVAAHLEPEILVIDEVLAVGDAEFQKKCLGKMDDVAKSGRTVLFVSHNMGAVQTLCAKSILLDKGKIISTGTTIDMVNKYLSYEAISKEIFLIDENKRIYFKSIEILNKNEVPQTLFTTDDSIKIKITVGAKIHVPITDFIFFICSQTVSKRLFIIEKSLDTIFTTYDGSQSKDIIIELGKNFLMPGLYYCEMGFLSAVSEYIDRKTSVGVFEIIYGETPLIKYGDRELGYFFPSNTIQIT
jgi:lipopolysaccharide transport system ATP-binding protein